MVFQVPKYNPYLTYAFSVVSEMLLWCLQVLTNELMEQMLQIRLHLGGENSC